MSCKSKQEGLLAKLTKEEIKVEQIKVIAELTKEQLNVEIPKNHIIMFTHDTIHRGNKYPASNIRYHVNFDVPEVTRRKKTVFDLHYSFVQKKKLCSTDELRSLLQEP